MCRPIIHLAVYCRGRWTAHGGEGMLFVPSSQLIEGMCVAEDVCDHHGRLLIARGQRIGHSHLTRLRKFGVLSLFIDPHNGEKPPPPTKSNLRKQCEAVVSAVCPKSPAEGA